MLNQRCEYDPTDAQGSVLTSLSASTVQGEQLYGPYGNQRYAQGSIGTDKGYTGQFNDALTGLDYYNARYYDPVAGVFLSLDSVQGNAQGADPYSYVGGNPETMTDPTGNRPACMPDDPSCLPDGSPKPQPPPTVDPTGGCGTGEHSTKNGCIYDGGACAGRGAGDFQPGSGGCVYSHGGCQGFTVPGCKQKHARDDAKKAAQQFGAIAGFLGSELISIIGTVLAVILAALDWWLAPIIAGIVAGLTLAATIVGNMAGDLAKVFSDEASSDDAWFTKARVEGDIPKLSDAIIGHDLTGGLASIAILFTAFFTSVLKGAYSSAANATVSAIKIFAGGATTALVTLLAVTAGAIWLTNMANDAINREEADLS